MSSDKWELWHIDSANLIAYPLTEEELIDRLYELCKNRSDTYEGHLSDDNGNMKRKITVGHYVEGGIMEYDNEEF